MEKQFSRDFILIIATISLLGGIANALNFNGEHNWKNTFYRMVGGSFSGLVFGFLACHYVGEENKYLVLSITGGGATLGLEGLRAIATRGQKALIAYISNK